MGALFQLKCNVKCSPLADLKSGSKMIPLNNLSNLSCFEKQQWFQIALLLCLLLLLESNSSFDTSPMKEIKNILMKTISRMCTCQENVAQKSVTVDVMGVQVPCNW